MVESAVASAEAQAVTLPADVWIDTMEQAIREHDETMRMHNPNGPM